MSTAAPPDRRPSEARDRLLRVASELFYREGIHAVGLDRVLSTAGVTRATMYRHFAGKEALVAAYLEREDALIRASFSTALARADLGAGLRVAPTDLGGGTGTG
ncbi:MAG: helix-turn-helix domain-containing protein, partial [Herbiconiux sp.]|nr:helix-turn-helix domain-containing protein [Herbiconiux sp.]